MISQTLALKLKKAGLQWIPAIHDFFSIPDRDFEDRVFVISDLLTNIEKLFGISVVAFQGASEWALDYLETGEAVWMPTEEQLRWQIEERLPQENDIRMTLNCSIDGYQLIIHLREQILVFKAVDASEAYGKALLHLLTRNPILN
jgi:hypothetical protein